MVLIPDRGAGWRGSGGSLLGDVRMVGGNQQVEGPAPESNVAGAIALLAEALGLLDALGAHHEAGARIQQIIDELEKETDRRDA